MKRLLVILLVLGLVLAGTGFAMGGNNPIYWENGWVHVQKRDVKTLDVTEQLSFTELDVRASVADVTVVSGDSFKLEARYEDGQTPAYSLDGGVLKVFDDGVQIHRAYLVSFGDITRSNRITITLPREHKLDSATVRTDMGDLWIDGPSAGSFTAKSGMGNVNIKRIAADVLSATASMGQIHAEDVKAATARFEADMGDATLMKLSTDGLVVIDRMGDVHVGGALRGVSSVHTDMGRVSVKTDLPRASYAELRAKSDMGDVREPLMDQGAAVTGTNHLTATSGMGDVEIHCADAPATHATPAAGQEGIESELPQLPEPPEAPEPPKAPQIP